MVIGGATKRGERTGAARRMCRWMDEFMGMAVWMDVCPMSSVCVFPDGCPADVLDTLAGSHT